MVVTIGTTMPRTPRQVVDLWVAAFNACDAEAAAALYAIDAVNTQFAAGPPVVGRDRTEPSVAVFGRV
jgi:ketosteroid isomerase-like protein